MPGSAVSGYSGWDEYPNKRFNTASEQGAYKTGFVMDLARPGRCYGQSLAPVRATR